MKYLIVILVLFSCSSVTKKAELQNEKFDKFFEQFSSESSFQLSRISFPIKYVAFDIMDELEESTIEKDSWEFTDFSEDANAASRDVDAFEIVLDQSTDGEVIYTRNGIDNGFGYIIIFC